MSVSSIKQLFVFLLEGDEETFSDCCDFSCCVSGSYAILDLKTWPHEEVYMVSNGETLQSISERCNAPFLLFDIHMLERVDFHGPTRYGPGRARFTLLPKTLIHLELGSQI